MIPALSLAWRTLVRRPRRLALFIAGVTVAAATLLDMVMLSAGLQRSLAGMLEATGYQVRATPRGLLPFEGEGSIPDVQALADDFRADPRVVEAVPLWGRTVYVAPAAAAGATTPRAAFGLGVPAGSTPTLRMRRGRPASELGEAVVDQELASALGLVPGDSIVIGLQPDPVVGGLRRQRTFTVSGVTDFVFAAEGSANLALRLDELWAMAGVSGRPAALLLVRVAPDADPYAVARDFRARTKVADIYAIPEIIEAAGDRLTYFNQLSLVLGTVSLAVAFLLVATLLTLLVNERWGEIATLRAIGVTRLRMLLQVAWQGFFISLAGATVGLGVGLIVARYLDTILRDFPGLPVDLSFFVLRLGDAVLSVALVVLSGLVAGLYPAWRAASVNIAAGLREEMA